jgi:hypothetical protein
MVPASELDLHVLGRLVRQVFGDDARVEGVRQIRPWTVARCDVADAEGVNTVIVKWLRSNPQGFRVDRRQILTEAAALEFTGEAAPGVGPALLAHDADNDLLITEDLAPRRTLHSVLSAGLTPTGIAGLHTFAATMGRLHAATAATRADGPWDGGARIPIGRQAGIELLDRLSELAPASRGVRTGVGAAIAAISESGPFDAFSNGDSGANNCLVASDGGDGRLIDFEHACRRHVLLDAAALHVPGSMWMTVADPVPLGVEDTYRRAAGDGLPAVIDDDLYGLGLAAACALRALDKLMRFDKLDGREQGHHSRPQLVTTIERTVATMERWGRLGAISAGEMATPTTPQIGHSEHHRLARAGRSYRRTSLAYSRHRRQPASGDRCDRGLLWRASRRCPGTVPG